ncbi:hypothetical protein AN191_07105 [Loktanella sp. 5RATIMAR09]|uniref:hypothetical protein n=1 Tax=Loktanella sp. 5RATIMAR09 TaxID=1225655 RepID=UPI0006EB411B|nr:hypothetical protein [Loktanella sp. 5RATIMAR09]KQI72763.1 hypothetical protein AN191_07105 [Loktanella sp. 5RATIMAR09]
MADRKRSSDGDQESKQVADTNDSNRGVPGAHGNPEGGHTGATGTSSVRSDHDEIEPSEDVDNDKA